MWLIILLLQAAADVCLSADHPVPALQKRSSECFDGLGCFSNDPPFTSMYRPISFLPESPEKIDPKFNLFTRQSPDSAHRISAGDRTSLAASTFRANRPTKFILHGFIDNGGTSWMQEMKYEFLKHGDYNVVLVDWGSGSLALYGQATANTRVLGAMMAQVIQFLQNATAAKPEDMHIIGHSLGAHAAGYAGERLQHLGRITGLDPAEPYFQNTDKAVRLDPSDALFVDVIHTDGASFYSTDLGFGMGQSCGHVDYFPNGGHDQPGCEEGPVTHLLTEGLITGIKEFVACNHLRSHHFFAETINSVCPFEAYRCDSEDDFNAGRCLPCSGQACGFMGLNADRVKPPRGTTEVKYYLKTGSHGPYCRYHFKVVLTFSGTDSFSHDERGQLYLLLSGRSGQTDEIKLTPESIYVQPGQTYTYMVTSLVDPGEVGHVAFRWDHDTDLEDVDSWNLLWLRHPKLYVDKIQVTSGHKIYNFCEHAAAVETDQAKVFSTFC